MEKERQLIKGGDHFKFSMVFGVGMTQNLP